MFLTNRKRARLEARNESLKVELDLLGDERDDLDKETRSLRRELMDLKSKKKIEEEEIKHMVKILDEKREIEYQKKELAMKADMEDRIAAVRTEYQAKVETGLNNQLREARTMYSEVLARLPNVNVKLKGDV